MKNLFYAATLLLFGGSTYAQSNIDVSKAITSTSSTSINKELARSEFHSFGVKEEFKAKDISKSSFRRSLAGEWKYIVTRGTTPRGYTTESFDAASWKSVAVPMLKPLSVTTNAITKVSKPFVVELPKNQFITTFRKDFGIPLSWDEREIYLHINNLAGGSVIYINGKRVAYNDDSRSLGEFNITKQCKDGANQLTIVSYSHTASTYLELGSNFVAGNIGDCYLTSLPKVMLRDYTIKSTFDPTYQNGLLEFGAIIQTHYLNPAEIKIFFDLYNEKNEVVDSQTKIAKLKRKKADTVYFNVSLRDVEAWNSEVPYLYRAEIRVQKDTRFTEYMAVNVGFREVKTDNKKLYINGTETEVKGVRLKPSDISGSDKELLNLLLDIKKSGVNSVWVNTVQQKYFYDLTDSLGLYVFNSANINGESSSKSLYYALANSRELLPKFIERTTNMYESVKSRPSVVVMALGESAGNGYNSYQSYLSIKDRDTSRPIIYNDAKSEWNTDIQLLCNPSYEQVKKYKSTTHPALAVDIKGGDVAKMWKNMGSDSDIQGLFIEDIKALDNKEVELAFSNIEIYLNGTDVILVNRLVHSKLDKFDVVVTLFAKDKTKDVVIAPFAAGIGQNERLSLVVPKLVISKSITMIDVKVQTKDGVVIKHQQFNI